MFPDGETEVMPTHVGIRKAKDMGLDLVVVTANSDPPVAKIIDYGEFSYQEKKKKNEAKKKQHRIEVKEVKFRPNTDDHDYNFKKDHAVRFLQEGNKVKATVFFRGREITHSNLGEKMLSQLIADIGDLGQAESRPRMEGRTMHIIIGPSKKKRPEKPAAKPVAAAAPAAAAPASGATSEAAPAVEAAAPEVAPREQPAETVS